MRVENRGMIFATLASCLVIAGCSGDDESELLPTHPVHGVLTHQDEPMSGAIVIFHPTKKGLVGGSPRGTADEDGKYRLTTFRTDDGAPAGEYKVTIYWPEPGPPDADPLPPDRLKNAYSDEKTTKLTATVSSDQTEIDFPLPLP